MQSGLNVSVRLCVGREDLSLQCLPHRNIYSTVLEEKKRKSNLSAVDGFSSCDDVLFYRFELFCDSQRFQPCVFAMWCAHNRDAEAAAAALTDNTASLLFWWCCHFLLCAFVCYADINTVRCWESSLPLPDVYGGPSLINVLIGRE